MKDLEKLFKIENHKPIHASGKFLQQETANQF
jgi:hypothetical protein